VSEGDDAIGKLERAFRLVIAADPLRKKLKQAQIKDWDVAKQHGLITEAEVAQLQAAKHAVDEVIAVDDFAPEELSPLYAEKLREMSEIGRAPRAAVG
jgi:acyl-CoA dehydrogenase